MKRTLQHRDVLAGSFFLLLGLAVALQATRYPLGTAMRMGPGYFPALLGLGLAALGLFIGFKGLRANHALDGLRFEPIKWRPALLVSAGVLLFAIAIQTAGLALSTLALVTISGIAHHEFRWRELLASGLTLAAVAVGVFAYGLHLPFRILPF